MYNPMTLTWIYNRIIRSDGVDASLQNGARLKNQIDTSIFIYTGKFKDASDNSLYIYVHEYDSSHNWIRRKQLTSTNRVYTPSSDCLYVRFTIQDADSSVDANASFVSAYFEMVDLKWMRDKFNSVDTQISTINSLMFKYNGHCPVNNVFTISSYVIEGWYTIFDGDWSNLTDEPTGITGGATLLVFYPANDNYSIKQMLIPTNAANIWVRYLSKD